MTFRILIGRSTTELATGTPMVYKVIEYIRSVLNSHFNFKAYMARKRTNFNT